jgi:hypothetical protein
MGTVVLAATVADGTGGLEVRNSFVDSGAVAEMANLIREAADWLRLPAGLRTDTHRQDLERRLRAAFPRVP